MGEANKDGVEKLELGIQNGHPRSLLKDLSSDKNSIDMSSNSELVDLNLRLSLSASSSLLAKESQISQSLIIAGIMPGNESDGQCDPPSLPMFHSLLRSQSVPAEKELEQRRLRELESLRRTEDERTTLERYKSVTPCSEADMPQTVQFGAPPPELQAWAAASAANNGALCRALLKIKSQANASQNPSTGAEGSFTAATGLVGFQSLPRWMVPERSVSSSAMANRYFIRPDNTEQGKASKKAKVPSFDVQCNGMDVMKQMPTVTTTGPGPDGRKIEGFLYRYVKDQVSIVCVCHGRFLSPAEFVKHAGGGDVPNPMKHINVLPTFRSH